MFLCSITLIQSCFIPYTQHFTPEKVLFVIDEDGVYTANPKQDPNATLIETTTIKELSRLSTRLDDHADVTRGMEGKLATIQTIARQGTDVIVVNGKKDNRVYDTLVGKKTTATIVYGEHA